MTSTVVLQVEQPGERADAILERVADELELQSIDPDDGGRVELFTELSYDEMYARTERALHSSGPDWYEHVALLKSPDSAV